MVTPAPTLKWYIEHNVDNVNKYEVVGHLKKRAYIFSEIYFKSIFLEALISLSAS